MRLGDADAIDELVTRWRAELDAGRIARGPAASLKRQRELGIGVRRLVWDPVVRDLDGAERVIIVPDGSLNLVPFAALPSDGSSYLLESGPTIHYLSAERDLARPASPIGIGQGLLALGAPAFEDVATALSAGITPGSRQDAAFRGPISDCPSFQAINFDVLPATGREANDVARLWNTFGPTSNTATRGSQVLLGRAAAEGSFKRLSPGRRVLHLATHGFFLGGDCDAVADGTRSVGGLAPRKKSPSADQKATPMVLTPRNKISTPAENPLLLSGLALAGANRRAAAKTDEEDGILTAEEVASLDLSGVEWAVLSACDTGLGEIKAGEGVFGLRRAFQIAGAHTVIMSLWSVEDRAAMTWMRALYEGRLARKLDTAAAVREASLAVLKQRRARGQSTHPFYWAGFVASGDWR